MLTLVTKTSKALEDLTLTRETMIFTATVAKNYEVAFNDLSTKIMMKCVKFLLHTQGPGLDVLALVKETKEHFPEANFDILHDLRVVASRVLQLPGALLQQKNFGCVLFLCLKKDDFLLQIGATWSSLTLKST